MVLDYREISKESIDEYNQKSSKSILDSIHSLLCLARQSSFVEPEELMSTIEDAYSSGHNPDEWGKIKSEIEAGAFRDLCDRNSWSVRFNNLVETFRDFYREISHTKEEDINKKWNVKSRQEAFAIITKDFADILGAIAKDVPAVMPHPWESDRTENMQLSARDEESTELELSVPFNFHLQASEKGKLKKNNRTLTGTLFPVDQISESAPAVGPGVKLYVPYEVACSAIGQVSGLPLDASISLDKHDKDNIVGVMKNARIQEDGKGGKEFVVEGTLWDWSRPEMVGLISASKEDLGMSMNAHAEGHIAIIDGQKVYSIDKIELLGANILKSSRATFKNTRLIAANAVDEDENDDIMYIDIDDDLEDDDLEDDDLEDDDLEDDDSEDDDLEDDDSEDDDLEDDDSEDDDLEDDDLEDDDLEDDDSEDDDLEDDDLEDDDLEDDDLEDDDLEDDDLEDDDSEDDDLYTPTINAAAKEGNMGNRYYDDLSDKIAQFTEATLDILTEISETQGILVEDYNDRFEQMEIMAEAEAEEEAEMNQQELIEAITANIMSQVDRKLDLVIQAASGNASRKSGVRQTVPARKTIPLSASAIDLDEEEDSPRGQARRKYELQLASLNGKIEALSNSPGTNSQDMMEAIEEKRRLLAKMR